MRLAEFIAKWRDCVGGAERGNAALYLTEMLTALDLPTPDPASAVTAHNDYVFERAVSSAFEGGTPRRIDLYKRGCFVLEAKQSRWRDRPKGAAFHPVEIERDMVQAPQRAQGRVWDTLMRNARAQAKSYVADLPPDHPAPPFVIICDVARSFEVWADFTGTGRGYSPFLDRARFRFSHHELADPDIQARMRSIWTDPSALDPTRRSAVITREITDELALVSQRLESEGHDPEEVAHFLMRCIFTIFAADVGLMPKDRLVAMIEDGVRAPSAFTPMLQDLWRRLNATDHANRFFSGLWALCAAHQRRPVSRAQGPSVGQLRSATPADGGAA